MESRWALCVAIINYNFLKTQEVVAPDHCSVEKLIMFWPRKLHQDGGIVLSLSDMWLHEIGQSKAP